MTFEDFLPLILGLVIICVMLLGFYWLLKKFAGKTNRFSNGRYARIIDRIVLTQDKQIQLVEIGDFVIIIGISASSISLLSKIKKDQLKLLEQDTPAASFRDVLSGFLTGSKDGGRRL
jgi:flagellar biosynthetic protein FliO